MIASCNETLPMREDLSNTVTINVRSLYYTTSHSSNTGSLLILTTLINNSDETLSEIAALTGTMEITWVPRIEEEGVFNRTRTMKINPENIFYAKNYNVFTKRLTIDQGDSIVLFVD